MTDLKKQLKEVKILFGENKHISIEPAEAIKLQDIFSIMIERKAVMKQCYDNRIHYQLNLPFSEFEKWLKSEIRNEKKLSRREWKIAIISAIIGGLIGIMPTIISLFIEGRI